MRPRRERENLSLIDITKRIEQDLGDSAVREALGPLGIEPSPGQVQAVRNYIVLLLFWNQVVNLTSLTHPVELLVRHFGESMFAVRAVPIGTGRLADFGSGAGFPGLAIKLLLPELEVQLIESNIKKTSFLHEIVRNLDLEGVRIASGRAEEVGLEANSYDFVTARAVGHFDKLLRSARRILRPNGRLILWLGSEDARRLGTSGGWRWQDPIPIPVSSRRVLLVGEKKAGTRDFERQRLKE